GPGGGTSLAFRAGAGGRAPVEEGTMPSGLWVGLAGALARVRELDVVANNLANADTDGFRAGRVTFATLLESNVRDVGAGPARGAPGRVFPTVAPATLDLSRGPIATTGGAL